MELLLVNHPLDCPICDQAGECKLQDYAFEYGAAHARTREPRRPLEEEGRPRPDDRVRPGALHPVPPLRALLPRGARAPASSMVQGRGDHSVIETAPGEPLDERLLDERGRHLPGRRAHHQGLPLQDPRLVPGRRAGRLHRLRERLQRAPRRREQPGLPLRAAPQRRGERDLDVRRGPPVLQADRRRQTACASRSCAAPTAGWSAAPSTPRSKRRRRASARAVDASGPGVVVALASPHATNEDLFTLRRLLEALGTASAAGVAVRSGRADALLIKAEKAANAAGARALGFGEPGARARPHPRRRRARADRARPRRARPAPSARARRCSAASTR